MNLQKHNNNKKQHNTAIDDVLPATSLVGNQF